MKDLYILFGEDVKKGFIKGEGASFKSKFSFIKKMIKYHGTSLLAGFREKIIIYFIQFICVQGIHLHSLD